MGGFGGQNRGRGGAILTPTNSFLRLGVVASVPILVKIKKCDRESACRRTDTLTDANRFYNLSHVVCYRYGPDKKK